jgi:hypothetical protein
LLDAAAISRFAAALGAAICILASGMTAGVASAADLMDEKAVALFQRMSETLGRAPTLSFTAKTLYDDIEPSGVKVKRGMVQEVTVMRPDRLHFRTVVEGMPTRTGWYDGKTLTVAVPAEQIYAQVDAPGTLDELLDLLQDRYGIYLPIVDLLYTDFYGRTEPYLLSGVLYGEKMIENHAVQHVSFETTPGDVQLWIDRSDIAPVPRRMVVTFTALEHEPEVVMHFEDWVLGDYVDPSVFEVVPRESWKKVEMPKEILEKG